jgi:hypothetical protein
MLSWFSANLSTILVSLVLLAVVIGIIARLRKDRKNGKSPCGGSCGHCPMSGSCHKK